MLFLEKSIRFLLAFFPFFSILSLGRIFAARPSGAGKHGAAGEAEEEPWAEQAI